MTIAEEILHAHMTNIIALLERALVIEKEADRPTVSALKRVRINMAALPREMLYVLQDGVTAKLWSREGRALQVLSKQRINMEQLSLQRDEVMVQNRQMV